MADPQIEVDELFVIYAHSRPGVLAAIASAFYRRGWNIQTLTVGTTLEPERSKIVIRLAGPRRDLERLAAALRNLVDVLSVDLYAGAALPVRELCVAPEAAPGRSAMIVRALQTWRPHALQSGPIMTDPKRYALGALFGPGLPDMVDHVPHARVLGIRAVETGPGFAVCMLPYREELIGDPARRVLFGGAITTLIDHASGLAVACALEQLTAIATIDLRVDYLRAATPGLDLYTRSECYRVTRNVAFVRATAYEQAPDDPFASCLGTFMLGANRSDSPFERLMPPAEPELT